MSLDWKTFALPERVELRAESGLHRFLLAHRDAAVRLSAARLRRVDTRVVQYLMAVARDWADRGLGFVVSDIAAPQAAVLTLIGVTPELLPWQEAA